MGWGGVGWEGMEWGGMACKGNRTVRWGVVLTEMIRSDVPIT